MDFKKRDVIKLVLTVFTIYQIIYMIVKYIAFMIKRKQCEWHVLNEINISLSFSVVTSIIFAIIALFFNRISTEFKENHRITFFMIKQVAAVSLNPFLQILDAIPFTKCNLKNDNKWNKTILFHNWFYVVYLVLYYLMISGNISSLVFYHLVKQRCNCCLNKIFRLIISILWSLENLAFVCVSIVTWVFRLTFDWTSLVSIILAPISLALELSLFCFESHDHQRLLDLS